MQVTDEMVRVAHAEYHKVLGDKNRSDPMRHALTAALAAMWRDMKDAPKDGTQVLLYSEDITPPTIQAQWRVHDAPYEYGEWVDVWNNDPIETSKGPIRPTRWMHRPPAPSQLSKRDDAERDSPQEA